MSFPFFDNLNQKVNWCNKKKKNPTNKIGKNVSEIYSICPFKVKINLLSNCFHTEAGLKAKLQSASRQRENVLKSITQGVRKAANQKEMHVTLLQSVWQKQGKRWVQLQILIVKTNFQQNTNFTQQDSIAKFDQLTH